MAELTLAVVGLTAQLFTTAVDCYRFISVARGLKRDSAIQYWKLRIQEVRLQNWGRYWKVDSKEFEDFLEEDDLVDDVRGILTQIKGLLQDSKKLKDKYGMKIEGLEEWEDPRPSRTSSGDRGVSKLEWAQKFIWSLKDKEKFEGLIGDLKELNDGLYLLLDVSERRKLSKCTQSDVLRMTHDMQECEDLSQACRLSDQVESSVRTTAHHRYKRTLDSPYAALIDAAGAKRLSIAQSQETLPPLGTTIPSNIARLHEREPSAVQGYMRQSPTHLRILAEYDSKAVLLEWKDVERNNLHQPLIAQRIENLAALLDSDSPKPEDFRVLDCVGYFKDSDMSRYGYLFHIPGHAAVQPPVTLHDLLSRGGPHEILPDLGDRFELARNLASCLLRLHECGWVHTSFRSDAVLFFYDQAYASEAPTTSPQPNLHSPYVSNFGYSKPSDPAESTIEFSSPNPLHDLYRHPMIVNARSSSSATERIKVQQRHDLFSLGIILLEIGLWEQIQALWKRKYRPEDFLNKLLTAYVPRLGHKMGTVYRNVVCDLLNMRVGASVPVHADLGSGVAQSLNEVELDWWSLVMRLDQCQA